MPHLAACGPSFAELQILSLQLPTDVGLCCCRLYRADNKVLLYSGIAQALLTAWALLLSVTAGTQPVVACECVTYFDAAEETASVTIHTCMSK